MQSVMVLHLHNVVELQLLLESFTRSDFIFTVLLLLSIVYQKIADRRGCLSQPMSGQSQGGWASSDVPHIVATIMSFLMALQAHYLPFIAMLK